VQKAAVQKRSKDHRHAADLMIAEARRRPGEVTLVTLGPVTNLALAALREPELPLLLRRWVMMGGSYRSAGNTAPTTEWNASVDPEALKVAITAFSEPETVERRTLAGLPPLPLALGLDVTERAKLLPRDLAALAARAGGGAATNPILRFVQDALRFYMDFHSRYDATGKTYAYSLWTEAEFVLPQRRPYVWTQPGLDWAAMDAAAAHFVGRQDFASVQNVGTPVLSTVRTVTALWREPGPTPDEMVWRIRADGFLKQMVRNIVGCLVAVGRGRLAPQDIPALLAARDRTLAPETAPPQGLCLECVEYKEIPDARDP